ncbi:MAG: tetratricopeptide repeat protein [Planctomycetes bacterium]|nr:tetratricopeptide repeat protein [Planctomycetota bacterium]
MTRGLASLHPRVGARTFCALVRPLLLYPLLALSGCSSQLSLAEIARHDGFDGGFESPDELRRAERAYSISDLPVALELTARLRDRYPENMRVHRLYQDVRIAAGQESALLEEYENLYRQHSCPLHDTLFSRLQSNPDRGAALAQSAVEKDDRFVWGWYARGWWDYKRERIDQAVAAFDRALELQPDFGPVLRANAILLRSKNQPAAALAAIERAMGSLSRNTEDRVFLASLRLSLGGAEARGALVEFRRIVEARPDHVDAAKGLAAALLEEGSNPGGWREAKAIYERLRQEAPGDPSIDFNLGVVYEIYERNLEAALECYRRFLERATDAPVYLRVRVQWWIQDLESERLRRATSREASLPATTSAPAPDGK